MLSGNEMVASGNNLIDFTELFDETLTNREGSNTSDSVGSYNADVSSRVNRRMGAKTESLRGSLEKDL
nr:unnamed protein product [Callosobruchus analis]